MFPRDTFARIAKALADPQRCEILECIAAAGELSCAAIHEKFRVSQATISHHLKELATAGLLERRKEGQFGYYRFLPDALRAYVDELGTRCCVRQHMAAAAEAAANAAAHGGGNASHEPSGDPAHAGSAPNAHSAPPAHGAPSHTTHGTPGSHAAHASTPHPHAPPAQASGHAHAAPSASTAAPHPGLAPSAMAIEMRRADSVPPVASPTGFFGAGSPKMTDR
jgi:DNA-binding transcriptional ArsR family regulator